ncbi:hypothetical protein [Klebsiella aerogenes]|uniref:hypothetical protein n=1 Tax=Klebsiella aerogenes TaxID=548 RepID=UPI0031E2BCBD
MISLSGMTSHVLDSERTTDGVTTTYTFPLTSFPDGAILDVAISLTTSTIKNCSYRLTVHKHNNIAGKVTVVSEYTYDGLSMSFTASFTSLTIVISTAVVGILKISPIHMNV